MDRGPLGLGHYDSLGKYCRPRTASSVFLILVQCSSRRFPLNFQNPDQLRAALRNMAYKSKNHFELSYDADNCKGDRQASRECTPDICAIML